MAVENDDDRLAVLEDFGVDIEIGGKTVIAIFDDGFEDSLGQWVTVPVLTARQMDFDYDKGEALSISNVAYTIAEEPRVDGHGMVTIILQKT